MKKTLIVANWKMQKNQAESVEFLHTLIPELEKTPPEREIVLCAPFTALGSLFNHLNGSQIRLGAQNVHWADGGAYTGEISASMLADIGVHYVIIGHCERRQCLCETEEIINLRLKAAQHYALIPILCVGETQQQRDAGETEKVLINQLKSSLVDVDLNHLLIAYEAVWAIGTGLTCQPSEANRVIRFIREQLDHKDISILYGGSVKPNNIDEIMTQPEIDGVMVGRASLDPVNLAQIANYSYSYSLC
ncbi:MAG: triose-phosphate isomerase [Moorea sp. SIO1G6]|uniref:triose-phosphate isomerase n=1 Tax=unclassified Moorena TaxID=2683338 RepID=UPI0013BA494F|nr:MULTISPECIES: triose-phosphate isomerase [unclassified Moorena]NEQ09435.1 triose-phosphate isomerase [Moorena sp. SIO4E2]NEQ12850.1 triose-phosphate isomerase [Moorena sp. SIO3E2]NES85505.1 triose-phosphate isomerase [Moorena sp. SIO2B7]NET69321.1 triose-phosphate isomerase [Moorena sp. SIO1G6]